MRRTLEKRRATGEHAMRRTLEKRRAKMCRQKAAAAARWRGVSGLRGASPELIILNLIIKKTYDRLLQEHAMRRTLEKRRAIATRHGVALEVVQRKMKNQLKRQRRDCKTLIPPTLLLMEPEGSLFHIFHRHRRGYQFFNGPSDSILFPPHEQRNIAVYRRVDFDYDYRNPTNCAARSESALPRNSKTFSSTGASALTVPTSGLYVTSSQRVAKEAAFQAFKFHLMSLGRAVVRDDAHGQRLWRIVQEVDQADGAEGSDHAEGRSSSRYPGWKNELAWEIFEKDHGSIFAGDYNREANDDLIGLLRFGRNFIEHVGDSWNAAVSEYL